MATIPPPTDSAYGFQPTTHPETAVRSLLASTWHVMEQVQRPPPTMHDILGAYRTKGDGDREMLLALLNAKAAEENRVAAITSLHRTLLDLYNGTGLPPPSVNGANCADSQAMFPSPPTSLYHQSPVIHTQSPRSRRRTSISPSSACSSERSVSPQSRKRRRSRSPLTRERRTRPSYDSSSVPPLDASFPPSPYSSSSQSSMGSPRSRESMAIGALLTPHEKDVEMVERRVSMERSTSGGSPRLRREDNGLHRG